jgi:hypothetical protein
VGISAPPVKPWPTRPTIIIASVVDRPHITEKAVNRPAASSRKVRRPSSFSSHEDSGMMTISATR